MLRWWWRLRAGISLAVILLIAAAGPALAGDDKASPSGAMLDMFGVTTTDGLSLSQEELAVSTRYKAFGKELPDPLLQIVSIIWYVYRIVVGFSLWFLRQAQSGSWRTGLVDATESTVTPFLSQLHDLGLPTVIGSAACMAATWAWVRGRTGASLGELGMIAVVFALATGVFASPAVTITEPGGYLDRSFSTARGLAAGMGEGSGDTTARTEQRMADILVAQPAQLMTFGELLSEECSKKHTAALKKHAGKDEADKIRDEVAKCDKRYKDSLPLEAVFGVGLFTWPFLTTVLAGMTSLSGLMIFLVCAVIWFSVEIAWNALWGIFPGNARMRLVNSLIKTVTALAALVVVLVAGSVVSQLLVALFDSVRGDNGAGLIDTFRAYAIASTVMTLLWIVLWWKVLSHLLRSRKRAEKTKQVVNPSQPVSMPQPSPVGGILGGIGQAGMNAAGSAIGARWGRGSGGGAPAPAGIQAYTAPTPASEPPPNPIPGDGPPPAPGQLTGRQPRPMLPPGPGKTPPAPADPGPPKPYANWMKANPNRLKNKLVSASTGLAAQAALAVATGGTSTMASAASSTVTKLAASAGQSALKKQLQTARQQGTTGVKPNSMNTTAQTAAPRPHEGPAAPTTAPRPHEGPAAPTGSRPTTPPAVTQKPSSPRAPTRAAELSTPRPAQRQPQPGPGPAVSTPPDLKDMTPSTDLARTQSTDRDPVTPTAVAENRAQHLRERLAQNETPPNRAPVAIS